MVEHSDVARKMRVQFASITPNKGCVDRYEDGLGCRPNVFNTKKGNINIINVSGWRN